MCKINIQEKRIFQATLDWSLASGSLKREFELYVGGLLLVRK